MITCQHARQLFDRYLDGELSPSLQAELHAHQLSCSACQTELAMLCNLSRNTFSRVVRDFASRRLVTLGYKSLTVNDPVRLRAVAEGG